VEILEAWSQSTTKKAAIMSTLKEMAIAVARAVPDRAEDAAILRYAADLLAGQQLLKVGEVAKILGVSSPTTIRNWLERGAFGADTIRSADGTRWFRMADVMAVKSRMEQTDVENEAGNIEFPDYGDEDPYAERRHDRTAISEPNLSSAEAADLLGVSVAVVNDLVEDGLLPGSTRLTNADDWQIPSSAVRALIDDQERLATSTAKNPYALSVSLGSSRRLPAREAAQEDGGPRARI
jgi:predicted DNA-binding transcriptional regulator AlpA